MEKQVEGCFLEADLDGIRPEGGPRSGGARRRAPSWPARHRPNGVRILAEPAARLSGPRRFDAGRGCRVPGVGGARRRRHRSEGDGLEFLQTELQKAGYTAIGSTEPLEDGSVVLDMTGTPDGCALQVTSTPTGSLTTITILYGAACPIG